MNLGYWNCRGTRRRNFSTKINYIRTKNHLQLLCLAETKQNKGPSVTTIKKMGFHKAIWSASAGSKGGLWLLLRSGPWLTNLAIIKISPHFIIVQTVLHEVEVLLICVYIPSRDQFKDDCWNII